MYECLWHGCSTIPICWYGYVYNRGILMMVSKKVPKDKRPFVSQYDEIVQMVFEGESGYYCDEYWYPTYDYAFNVRALLF